MKKIAAAITILLCVWVGTDPGTPADPSDPPPAPRNHWCC
jgi:hypothetical protein